jgi:trigger factor
VGDVVTVNTKDLFEDAHQLMFESRSWWVHTLEVDVDFTIEEINTTDGWIEPRVFDKFFGEGSSFYWRIESED